MAFKIVNMYNKLDKILSNDPNLLNNVTSELSRLVSNAYSQALSSDEGYCFKFTLPMTAVLNLYQMLNLSKDEVGDAFKSDWKYPADANMYSDPYYHILLLLLYYGIRKNKTLIIEHSLFLILMKMWNGRKSKYLKFCDKRIMDYVVNYMVNNKHLVSKYDSPLNLLKDYFIPTLLNKYQSEILKDPMRLKQLFMQIWARLDQLFVFNMKINPITGVNEAQGGLLALYIKAKKQNLYVTSPKTSAVDDEGVSSVDTYTTIHNRDELTSVTTDYITMNVKPQYSQDFIEAVNSHTKVSVHVIEQILQSLHNHNYYDILHSIISIILSRTNVLDKSDICSPNFVNLVKKNIISSKNTTDIRNIQKLLDLLLTQIFESKLKLDFNKYSNVQKIQIRNVVIYGLIYNLKKIHCQGQQNIF